MEKGKGHCENRSRKKYSSTSDEKNKLQQKQNGKIKALGNKDSWLASENVQCYAMKDKDR